MLLCITKDVFSSWLLYSVVHCWNLLIFKRELKQLKDSVKAIVSPFNISAFKVYLNYIIVFFWEIKISDFNIINTTLCESLFSACQHSIWPFFTEALATLILDDIMIINLTLLGAIFYISSYFCLLVNWTKFWNTKVTERRLEKIWYASLPLLNEMCGQMHDPNISPVESIKNRWMSLRR